MTATTSSAEPVRPGTPERAALIEAARKPAAETLGRPVRFKVEHLDRIGDWALLRASMVETDGRPVDYTGTPLADAASEGAVSKAYAALLKKEHGAWRVVAKAVGPTDVAWATWDKDFGAPSALVRP